MYQVSTIRRGAPWLLALVVAALLALGLAPPALAHDQLVSTSPEAGSTVTAAPKKISLTFNGTVVSTGTRIVLTGPSGRAAEATVRVDGATISRPAPPQAADGTYTVTWRATSSDGHPVSGTFRYTVRAAAAPGSSAAPVVPTGPSAASAAPTSHAPASTSGDPAPAAHKGTGVSPWAIVVLAVMLLIVGTVIARRRMKP